MDGMGTVMGWMIGRRMWMAGALAVASILAGCAASESASLDRALADYEAARYQEAYDASVAAMERSRGEARASAAYLAGLSAYQMKRTSEAQRLLAPIAADDANPVAGHAAAVLGMIEMQADRPRTAVGHFKRAMALLDGEDRAQAAYQCGRAYQALGQESAAQAQFIVARSATGDAGLRDAIATNLDVTGFTIQIGAFSTRGNAEDAAAAYLKDNPTARLGEPRIVQRRGPRGETLYMVQVGRFVTHDAAQRALAQVRGTAMVTTLAEDRNDLASGQG